MSAFQVGRLIKKYLPEDANPTITNERRMEALSDPYNFLSNAIVLSAMFTENNYEPALVINFDTMSVVSSIKH